MYHVGGLAKYQYLHTGTGILSKQFPSNYTVLVVFNLALNYVVCRASYLFPPHSVLTSCILYLSVITGFTLYLSNCEKHVNIKNASITALASMLVGGVLVMVFYEISLVKFLLCSIGGSFVSAYLIYSTHLLFEDRRQSLHLDDEIMGVVSCYTDVFSVIKHLFDGDQLPPTRL